MREQIAPFDVDFAASDIDLDFTHMRDHMKRILSGEVSLFAMSSSNAIVRMLGTGGPRVLHYKVRAVRQALHGGGRITKGGVRGITYRLCLSSGGPRVLHFKVRVVLELLALAGRTLREGSDMQAYPVPMLLPLPCPSQLDSKKELQRQLKAVCEFVTRWTWRSNLSCFTVTLHALPPSQVDSGRGCRGTSSGV